VESESAEFSLRLAELTSSWNEAYSLSSSSQLIELAMTFFVVEFSCKKVVFGEDSSQILRASNGVFGA
jgi:hypothetical protein